jgi:hypothetical protein
LGNLELLTQRLTKTSAQTQKRAVDVLCYRFAAEGFFRKTISIGVWGRKEAPLRCLMTDPSFRNT